MKPVSPQCIAVYEYIERIYRTSNSFPSYQEIAAALGIGLITVEYRIKKLVRRGWITKEFKTARAYTLCREPKTYYAP